MNNKEEQEALRQMLQEEEHACIPVFLSDEISDLHYNGFSNR